MEMLKIGGVPADESELGCVYRSADRIWPATRVLLADGHDVIRRGVRDFLEKDRRCKVVAEARDGRDALRLARESRPDLAIIEYTLPAMNGLGLTCAMRREGLATKVLVYTMQDSPDVIANALEAGIRAYVLKSDSEAGLLAAIEALSKGRPYFSPAVSDTLLAKFLEDETRRPRGGLTQREREIVQLIAEGSLNKVIAHKLGVTLKTIETHRASAMRKLKVRTTAQLVRWAIRNDLVQA